MQWWMRPISPPHLPHISRISPVYLRLAERAHAVVDAPRPEAPLSKGLGLGLGFRLGLGIGVGTGLGIGLGLGLACEISKPRPSPSSTFSNGTRTFSKRISMWPGEGWGYG